MVVIPPPIGVMTVSLRNGIVLRPNAPNFVTSIPVNTHRYIRRYAGSNVRLKVAKLG